MNSNSHSAPKPKTLNAQHGAFHVLAAGTDDAPAHLAETLGNFSKFALDLGGSHNEGYHVVPKIRFIAFWGLCWGPPIFGNYHLEVKGPSKRRWGSGNYLFTQDFG